MDQVKRLLSFAGPAASTSGVVNATTSSVAPLSSSEGSRVETSSEGSRSVAQLLQDRTVRQVRDELRALRCCAEGSSQQVLERWLVCQHVASLAPSAVAEGSFFERLEWLLLEQWVSASADSSSAASSSADVNNTDRFHAQLLLLQRALRAIGAVKSPLELRAFVDQSRRPSRRGLSADQVALLNEAERLLGLGGLCVDSSDLRDWWGKILGDRGSNIGATEAAKRAINLLLPKLRKRRDILSSAWFGAFVEKLFGHTEERTADVFRSYADRCLDILDDLSWNDKVDAVRRWADCSQEQAEAQLEDSLSPQCFSNFVEAFRSHCLDLAEIQTSLEPKNVVQELLEEDWDAFDSVSSSLKVQRYSMDGALVVREEHKLDSLGIVIREFGIPVEKVLCINRNTRELSEAKAFSEEDSSDALAVEDALNALAGAGADVVLEFAKPSTFLVSLGSSWKVEGSCGVGHHAVLNCPIVPKQRVSLLDLSRGVRDLCVRLVLQIEFSSVGHPLFKLCQSWMSDMSTRVPDSGRVLKLAFEQRADIAGSPSDELVFGLSSSTRRQQIFALLNRKLEERWHASLEVTSDHAPHADAKRVLSELFNHNIAVVQAPSVKPLRMEISKVARARLVEFVVEMSNFNSFMSSLTECAAQPVAFVAIRIAGDGLPPSFVVRLVDSVLSMGQNLRVFLINCKGLLHSLALVRRLSSVFVDPNLANSFTSSYFQVQPYKGSFAAACTEASSRFAEFVVECVEGVRASSRCSDWREKEAEWRAAPSSGTLAVLITPDFGTVEEHLRQASIFVLDCRDPNVEQRFLAYVAAADTTASTITRTAIAFSYANCLSDTQKSLFAQVARDNSLKIEFIVPVLDPSDLRVRIVHPVTGSSDVVVACAIEARDKRYGVLESDVGSERECGTFFALLRCCLGKDTLFLSDVPLLKDFLDGRNLNLVTELLKRLVYVSRSVLVDFLEGLKEKGEMRSTAAFRFARHIRLTLRTDSDWIDVSFSDCVRRTPAACWMLQSSRIQLWLTVVGSPVDPIKDILSRGNEVSCESLLGFFLDPSTSPSYLCGSSACLSDAHALSQQFVQNNELPWEAAASSWVIFPFSSDVVITMLRTYPFFLKALFCLNPLTLYNIVSCLNSAEFPAEMVERLQRILTDKYLCAVIESVGDLSGKLSALRWALCVCGFAKEFEMSDRDVSNILSLRLPVPGVDIPGVDKKRMLAMFLQLDNRDALWNMHAVRRYLKDVVPDVVLSDVLRSACAGGNSKIGASFLSFLNRITTETEAPLLPFLAQPSSGQGALSCPEVMSLVRAMQQPELIPSLGEIWIRSLTIDALALIVGLSEGHIKALAPFLSPERTTEVIRGTLNSGTCRPTVVVAMVEAFPHPVGHELFDILVRVLGGASWVHVYGKVSQLRIDLTLSPRLKAAFLALHVDGAAEMSVSMLAQADHHIRSMLTFESQTELLAELLKRPECGPHISLTCLLWSQTAKEFLPDTMLRSDVAKSTLMWISKQEHFAQLVASRLSSCSALSSFLVCEWTLDADSINHFRGIFNEPPLETQSWMVAQADDDARAYSVSVTQREIPSHVLDGLLRGMSSVGLKLPVWSSAEGVGVVDSSLATSVRTVLDFFPFADVSSGVSSTSILRNAIALVNVPLLEFPGARLELVEPTQHHVALVLQLWFAAFGVSADHLSSRIIPLALETQSLGDEQKGRVLQNLSNFLSRMKARCNDHDHVRATLFPVPSYLETRVAVANSALVQFLGKSAVEERYTAQCIELFTVPAHLQSSDWRWQSKPHVAASSAFGKRLVECSESDCEALVRPFLSCLRRSTNGISGLTTHAREMVEAVVEGLASRKADPVRMARISRCLVMPLLGNMNDHPLVATVLQVLTLKRCSFCRNANFEITWLKKEGFLPERLPCFPDANLVQIQGKNASKSGKNSPPLTEAAVESFAARGSFAASSLPPSFSTSLGQPPPEVSTIGPSVVSQRLADDEWRSHSTVSPFRLVEKSDVAGPVRNGTQQVHRAGIFSGTAEQILTLSETLSFCALVECSALFELVPSAEGVACATLRIKQGATCFLVQSAGHVPGFSGDLRRSVGWVMRDAVDFVDSDVIAQVFQTYEQAWSSLFGFLKVGSVVYCGYGLYLKKCSSGSWVPIFTLGEESLSSKRNLPVDFKFFDAVAVHALCGVQPTDGLMELLEFLIQVVADWVVRHRSTDSLFVCPACMADLKQNEDHFFNSHLRCAEMVVCGRFHDLFTGEPYNRDVFVRAADHLMSVVAEFVHITQTELIENVEALQDCVRRKGGVAEHRMFTKSFVGFFQRLTAEVHAWLESPACRPLISFFFEEKVAHCATLLDLFPAVEFEERPSDADPSRVASQHSTFGFGFPPHYEMQPLCLFGTGPPVSYVQLKSLASTSSVFCFVHWSVLHRVLCNWKSQVGEFCLWVTRLLESPLRARLKEQLLHMCSVDSVGQGLAKLTRAERVMVYALAFACPVEYLRKVLCNAYPLPHAFSRFCEVKAAPDCYSVYFCGTHVLRQLQDLKLPVVELDLKSEAGKSPDELYLSIIRCFRGMTCFVYVRGVRVLDDLLFKWCAEFTKLFPFAFIYFEETDCSFAFAENRDRAFFHLWRRPSVIEWRLAISSSRMDVNEVNYTTRVIDGVPMHELVDALWPRKFQLSAPTSGFLILRRSVEVDRRCRWEARCCLSPCVDMDDWYVKVEQRIHDECFPWVLLLESPPGAGKTHLLRSLKPKISHLSVITIDCSDDRLVNTSFSQVLAEAVPDSLGNVLLVADEYHFLSQKHKRVLLSWMVSRLASVKLLMIANRSDEFDGLLLSTFKSHVFSHAVAASSGNVIGGAGFVDHWRVRLPLHRIETANPSSSVEETRFTRVFFQSARALFGEEILSLRVVPLFRAQRKDTLGLAALLREKMPSLGNVTCFEFCHSLVQIFAELETRKFGALEGNAQTPFRLLVKASLLEFTPCLCSYPDFARELGTSNGSDGSPLSHEVHPLLRLGAWVTMLYEFHGLKTPGLAPLFRLSVIDQSGFPFIVSARGIGGSSCYPWRCDAFSRSGDYTDLEWIANSIRKGFSIDWKAVALRWRETFVTNVRAFAQLATVCPDPGALFDAIDRKNLSLLVSRGDEALWALVVRFTARSATTNEVSQYSPFHSACWRLLLTQASAPYTVPFSMEHVLAVLVWASQYAYEELLVYADVEGRSEFVRGLLVQVTCQIISDTSLAPSAAALLTTLWTGNFKQLLRIGCERGGIPYRALLLLVKDTPLTSIPREWPAIASRLARIYSCAVEAKFDLHLLEGSEMFSRLRQLTANDYHEAVLTDGLAEAVVKVFDRAGTKPSLWWQLTILRSFASSLPAASCSAMDTERTLELLEDVVCDARAVPVFRSEHASTWEKASLLGRLRDAFIHNEKAFSGMDCVSWVPESRKIARTRHQMRFLKKLFVPKAGVDTEIMAAPILRFYNEITGSTSEERRKEGSMEDPAKGLNAKGPDYDLGRVGAFTMFSVLIGCFYRQINKRDFEEKVLTSMRKLGLNVDCVWKEADFLVRLDPKRYHVAFIMSSEALEWMKEVRAETFEAQRDLWARFVDRVDFFHRSGRGLFIMAEDEPFLDHANAVLDRIGKIRLAGNYLGESNLVLVNSKTEFETKGGFLNHLTTGSLVSLFEGSTVCAPSNSVCGELVPVARLMARPGSYNAHPCILVGGPKDFCQFDRSLLGKDFSFAPGSGRVVVDTGFTKLWVNWTKVGVERYVMNATVWLLSLDYKLNRAIHTGVADVDFVGCTSVTVAAAPFAGFVPEVSSREMWDLYFCLDGSGSVGSDGFVLSIRFVSRAIAALKSIGVAFGELGARVCVLQFASAVTVEFPLSADTDALQRRIEQGMTYMGSGTDFAAAFRSIVTSHNERGGRRVGKGSKSRPIVVFVTDGESSQYQTELGQLQRTGALIIPVGVGNVNMGQLKGMSSSGNVLTASDFSQLDKLLGTLVQEIRLSAVGKNFQKIN